MIAVTSVQRVAVHFDPVGSWLLVALVTVALLAVLLAVVAALWVSRADTVVIDWITNYWNHFSLWVQSLVT